MPDRVIRFTASGLATGAKVGPESEVVAELRGLVLERLDDMMVFRSWRATDDSRRVISLLWRPWTLAKFMGAWLSFSRVFNQFSISHLIEIGFVGLSLQQPD